MRELKKNEKGFTLVELVVVIAILAVLVTLIVPKIMGNVADAQKSTEIGNARTLASEITVWNAKQTDSSKRIVDSNSDGKVSLSEYKNQLDLPSGVTWPTGTYAEIAIDADGNASVNIK